MLRVGDVVDMGNANRDTAGFVYIGRIGGPGMTSARLRHAGHQHGDGVCKTTLADYLSGSIRADATHRLAAPRGFARP